MIYKNYLVICISFFMLFVAFNGIQNLQRQANLENCDVHDNVLLLTLNVGGSFKLRAIELFYCKNR